MANNAMVAVLDILGFKKLVHTLPLETITNDVLGYLRQALASAIYQCDTPSDTPSVDELKNQSRVGFAWFSDTLLFYTRNDNLEECQNLIQTVSWLIGHTVLVPGLRLRGGIAYGELFHDSINDIYIGKAIVDAYQLEKKQEWSGGAFTKSAKEKIPSQYCTGRYLDWPIIEYDVPIKPSKDFGYRSNDTYGEVEKYKQELRNQGETKRLLAINWTFQHVMPVNLLDNLDPKYDDAKAKHKLSNSQKFHDQVCRWCGDNMSNDDIHQTPL